MTTIQSTRFGTIEVAAENIVEFPAGLIGLGGLRYALLDPSPGSNFFWLHSLEDPALALPVVDPRTFFRPFALAVSDEDRERIGAEDPEAADVYVTVRTAPDPVDTLVNLRAPLVIWERRGYQVLNGAPGAELRVPLFAPADPPHERSAQSMGGGTPIADAA
ncbi:MAG TPA: flagellar assembly protein FliW [Solirubrobacteraceae bacterium]|jgi:flagellar assembly factor FliW